MVCFDDVVRLVGWLGALTLAVSLAACQPPGELLTGCEGDAACRDGANDDQTCEQHTDCAIGQQCIGGVCQPAPRCESDDDCRGEHVCRRGECYRPVPDAGSANDGTADSADSAGDTVADTSCSTPPDASPADADVCPGRDGDIGGGDADDGDGDDIPAAEDNCPEVANPDQENCDGDDQGNACDTDDDGDGTPDEDDCAPCDDAVHPGVAGDCCNGKDDDCDGEVDEDAACHNNCSCQNGACFNGMALCGNSC